MVSGLDDTTHRRYNGVMLPQRPACPPPFGSTPIRRTRLVKMLLQVHDRDTCECTLAEKHQLLQGQYIELRGDFFALTGLGRATIAKALAHPWRKPCG